MLEMLTEQEQQTVAINLNSDALEVLAQVGDENLRKKIEQMLVDAQQAAIEASAKSKTVRGRSAKLDPVKYVAGILEQDKNLDTMLEIIALSSAILYPEVTDKAKEHFGEQFKEFVGVDFLRIIYTIVDKQYGWGNRDMGGRLTALYETLPWVEKQPPEQTLNTQENTESPLDSLPVPTPTTIITEKETEQEQPETKSTTTAKRNK